MNYVLIHAFVPSRDSVNPNYSDVEPHLEVSKPMSYSDARLSLDKQVAETIANNENLALLDNDSFYFIFHTMKVISYWENSTVTEWWELKEIHGTDSNIRYPKENLIEE